jgi:hypothetical protein
MNQEAWFMTKFFSDEATPMEVIITRLTEHYGEDAISAPTVFH